MTSFGNRDVLVLQRVHDLQRVVARFETRPFIAAQDEANQLAVLW